MNINKLVMLSKMSLDREARKVVFKMYDIFKEDPNFNISKYIKLMSSMLKGEKIVKYEDMYIISAFLPPLLSEAFYSNIWAVEEKENIFSQQVHAKRSAPISFYLSLTNKCPNNCLYCSSKKRLEEDELSTKEWIDLIKDIQDMKTSIIGLTGGEPMIREDIFEIIASIDDRSVSTLFTSGYNLSLEKAKELKKAGLFSIGISLDSFDRDRHNTNRASGRAFDYAIEAIQNARRAGIYTMAQTVVLKDELDEERLLKHFKFAGENGVHEVKILEPILSGNLLEREDLGNLLYSPEDRRKLISIQHKANRRSRLPKITSFAYTESEEKFGCGAGGQHSYISASGDLYPCDFVPMEFGSIREKGIKDLWKEMNQIIGRPKIGCFAQMVNREVYEEANKELPLCKEKALKVCEQFEFDKFPKYYRDLQ